MGDKFFAVQTFLLGEVTKETSGRYGATSSASGRNTFSRGETLLHRRVTTAKPNVFIKPKVSADVAVWYAKGKKEKIVQNEAAECGGCCFSCPAFSN